MRSRDEAIAAVRAVAAAGESPVLIVGAGINGIGLYRELALQGVPAILVDKADFASGTSAAPSRLIHGGLRYLETGEFALVRESVVERNHLLRNAPHLVRPLPVWVPAFNWFGGMLSAGLRFFKLKKTPGAKGIFVVKLGLVFFDRFGRANRRMPDHRIVPQKEVRRRMPGIAPRVRAVAEYYDARLVHPERLSLELVKDAERDCPASVAVPYLGLASTEGREVVLRDEIGGEEIRLAPRLVVNCTGAWADEANRRLGIDGRLIGGTRGSHLVLRRPDLARQLGDGMLYFETHDFRACLIYALDDGLILIGTTDIRAEDPDHVACSEDEIDYLFGVIDEVLPGAALTRDEIVFAYAGIRPLPYSGDSTTGSISRDHSMRSYEADATHGFPIITLVGGKWTTYRACAEQLGDAVLARLGTKRRGSTLDAPIGGGAGFAQNADERTAEVARVASASGLDRAAAERLYDRYGSEAIAVAAALAADADRVDDRGFYRSGEIRWITANERVARLADIILRRTLMPFEGVVSLEGLRRAAQIAGDVLGWDAARQGREVADTATLLTERHRVRLDHAG